MQPLFVLQPAALPRGTYLRVVVTARCPLACSYCHMEGDPALPGTAAGLDTSVWLDLLHVAVDCGARKIKLVGGEPLIRRDLPEIIASISARDGAVDISVITSGAAPREAIERCFDAGLSRCNITIHGFRGREFEERGGTRRHLHLRSELLDAVLARGRPTKLNYVYTGPDCEADLAALLEFAAARPCVVGVLDDLSRPDFDHRTVLDALRRVVGEPVERWEEPDPHSFAALRLRMCSGVVVEVKDRRLGEVAPWASCGVCLRRRWCREGIVALRLTHTGVLRPCMDRGDLGIDLLAALRSGGRGAARALWRDWLAQEVAS